MRVQVGLRGVEVHRPKRFNYGKTEHLWWAGQAVPVLAWVSNAPEVSLRRRMGLIAYRHVNDGATDLEQLVIALNGCRLLEAR